MNGATAATAERIFSAVSRQFIYSMVWEDPVLDLQALDMSGKRVLTIASAGCNVLAYLEHEPASIVAVDRNWPHLALTRLKLTAAQRLPHHEAFFRFFGIAECEDNLTAYEQWLRLHLDAATRRFWDERDWHGRPRASVFQRNFYRHCGSAQLVRVVWALMRLHGTRVESPLSASSLEDQRRCFASSRLVWRNPLLRWLCNRSSFWFKAGIAPRQFQLLQEASQGDFATWAEAGLRHIVCDFPIADNYFAWQLLSLRYDRAQRRAIPPYLRAGAFAKLSSSAGRVETHWGDLTKFLATQPPGSFDCFALLDVFDWMELDQVDALWEQIDRTASAGARVIYRSVAPRKSYPAPGELKARWPAMPERTAHLAQRDRSGLYGSFQLHVREGAI